MKELMFSRQFQKGHPKAGQPTYFVEKICNSLLMQGYSIYTDNTPVDFLMSLSTVLFRAKNHTIRAGNRFKAGDRANFKVWSGIPYRSKKIIFAVGIKIKKTWDFEMDFDGVYAINGKYIDNDLYPVLSQNDGLTEEDMFFWFMPNYNKPKEFKGQIICWDEKINY